MAERVEDLNLPNTVVTRIIKECLPEGVNVAKEARTAVARAASVFVLYLTSEANNAAQQSNRKTITANDVFKALEVADFGFFVDPLKESLEGFKKSQQARKQIAAARKKESEELNNRKAEEGEGEEEEKDEEEEEEKKEEEGEEEGGGGGAEEGDRVVELMEEEEDDDDEDDDPMPDDHDANS